MLLGIRHAQSKIKSTNERAILMETGLMPSLFSVQENFPWPRKAFLSAYSEIPHLRSRDANLRAEELELVQKAILKCGLVVIWDSHSLLWDENVAHILSHNSKKIIVVEIDHSSLFACSESQECFTLYCPTLSSSVLTPHLLIWRFQKCSWAFSLCPHCSICSVTNVHSLDFPISLLSV